MYAHTEFFHIKDKAEVSEEKTLKKIKGHCLSITIFDRLVH